jgi:hypothetical protein
MPYLAKDKKGNEFIYDRKEDVHEGDKSHYQFIALPKGTIKKIIGRELKETEMPVKLEL